MWTEIIGSVSCVYICRNVPNVNFKNCFKSVCNLEMCIMLISEKLKDLCNLCKWWIVCKVCVYGMVERKCFMCVYCVH